MKSLTVLFLICSFEGIAQLSLDECHEKSKSNYPLLKQYDVLEQTKDYDLSNAGKSFLPQLDITVIGGVLEGFPSFTPGSESSGAEFKMISMIQLNQMIWDGGMTKARRGIIESKAQLASAHLDVSMYQLRDRVNQVYFGTLLIDKHIARLRSLLSSFSRNKKRIAVAIENGTANATDLDELDVEMLKLEQEIIQLQGSRKSYLQVLALYIGEPLDENTSLRVPDFMPFRPAQITRPELRAFSAEEQLVTSSARLTKSTMYPKIGLTGFGVFIQPGQPFGISELDHLLVAGLSVNWTLGSLYSNKNNQKLDELRLAKIQTQREVFLFNTQLLTARQERELETLQVLIEKDRDLVQLRSRIRSAYETKFSNGVATMSELTDKSRDESLAEEQLATHELQYIMKFYEYKNSTGSL